MLSPYELGHCLRALSMPLLVVPKARLVAKCGQTFAVWAPQPCNSLPDLDTEVNGYRIAGKFCILL